MRPGFPYRPRINAGRALPGCAPTWATWLLLLALVLRGMIPLGYMPTPVTAGGPAAAGPFIPCLGGQPDAWGALHAAEHATNQGHPPGDADHADHTGHHPDGNTPPCVFAAIAALAVGLTLLLALPVRRRPPQTWDGIAAVPRPRLPPPGTRLARGPPVLSLTP